VSALRCRNLGRGDSSGRCIVYFVVAVDFFAVCRLYLSSFSACRNSVSGLRTDGWELVYKYSGERCSLPCKRESCFEHFLLEWPLWRPDDLSPSLNHAETCWLETLQKKTAQDAYAGAVSLVFRRRSIRMQGMPPTRLVISKCNPPAVSTYFSW